MLPPGASVDLASAAQPTSTRIGPATRAPSKNRADRGPPTDQNVRPTTSFSTQVPVFWNNNALTAQLRAEQVQVNAQNPNPGTSVLTEILLGFGPTILLIGLFWLLARRAQSGAGVWVGWALLDARRRGGWIRKRSG